MDGILHNNSGDGFRLIPGTGTSLLLSRSPQLIVCVDRFSPHFQRATAGHHSDEKRNDHMSNLKPIAPLSVSVHQHGHENLLLWTEIPLSIKTATSRKFS